MRPGWSVLAVLGIAGAAGALGPAATAGGALATPDTLTPDGPATLQRTWLGARPAIAEGPQVIVGWKVAVGPGGRAGPIALRVFGRDSGGPRSSRVTLPAAPGTYDYDARLPVPNGNDVGLDQEAGGHAILHAHPHQGEPGDTLSNPHAVDLWRPPLRIGEERGRTERLSDHELLVEVDLERDLDEDGYGDETQDVTDLALTATSRRRGGRVRARLSVRNRGRRAVSHPRVTIALGEDDRLRGLRATGCASPLAFTRGAPPALGRCAVTSPIERPASRVVALPAIAPGRQRILAFTVLPARGSGRIRVSAAGEGRDRTPARATLRLRAARTRR